MGEQQANSRRGLGFTHLSISPQELLKNVCPSGLLEPLMRVSTVTTDLEKYLVRANACVPFHLVTQFPGVDAWKKSCTGASVAGSSSSKKQRKWPTRALQEGSFTVCAVVT